MTIVFQFSSKHRENRKSSPTSALKDKYHPKGNTPKTLNKTTRKAYHKATIKYRNNTIHTSTGNPKPIASTPNKPFRNPVKNHRPLKQP